jgi:hypothetical protein
MECDKCGKVFQYKYLLERHKNKKNPCETMENINSVYDKKIKAIKDEIIMKTKKSMEKEKMCFFCNNKQSHKNNTYRHIKKHCKVKKELELEIEKITENKNKLINNRELNLLREENKLLKMNKTENVTKNITINNNINNNTINNNTINTQNNLIVINPFGKEDLSHITIEDYNKYLNGFFPGFIKFIEKVHFDENAPQNKNISITNLRSKYLSVHDGDRWLTQDKNDVIDNLLIKKHNQLAGICEELEEKDKIDKSTVDNFEEFCQNYNDIEAKKNTRENVIMMIYDNINNVGDIKPKKKVLKK